MWRRGAHKTSPSKMSTQRGQPRADAAGRARGEQWRSRGKIRWNGEDGRQASEQGRQRVERSRQGLSLRLRGVVDALPLRPGLRVLEIGGAPGAAARAVAREVGPAGRVLVVDRSPMGIAATHRSCEDEIAAGTLSTLCASVEDFTLPSDIALFDIAFACRVGALDGRHPKLFDAALRCIAQALTPTGRLFIDTGNPLTEITLPR